jgi:hypothetical protein
VKIRIDQRYPMADVAQAHRDLEARKTTGSTVLCRSGASAAALLFAAARRAPQAS